MHSSSKSPQVETLLGLPFVQRNFTPRKVRKNQAQSNSSLRTLLASDRVRKGKGEDVRSTSSRPVTSAQHPASPAESCVEQVTVKVSRRRSKIGPLPSFQESPTHSPFGGRGRRVKYPASKQPRSSADWVWKVLRCHYPALNIEMLLSRDDHAIGHSTRANISKCSDCPRASS